MSYEKLIRPLHNTDTSQLWTVLLEPLNFYYYYFSQQEPKLSCVTFFVKGFYLSTYVLTDLLTYSGKLSSQTLS